MIKQTIMITNPASLSLKYQQMVIRLSESEQEITRPIEDIGVIIIDNQMVKLSIPLINALTDNKVAVIYCGANGMPSSMLMPLESNKTQQEVYRYQIEATQPTNKRIWKELIESKIRNQAQCLERCGMDGAVLKPYYSNVLSGDKDNREGAAARIYWQTMYGKKFIRDRDGDAPNHLLNYGYAVLRAAVGRALMGSGLFPAFGLFHRNRYNAFPLADDVMEPYRPFVDDVVYGLYRDNQDVELTKETKQRLVSILTCDVQMNKQTKPLMVALSSTTASIAKSLKDNKGSIICPSFP